MVDPIPQIEVSRAIIQPDLEGQMTMSEDKPIEVFVLKDFPGIYHQPFLILPQKNPIA